MATTAERPRLHVLQAIERRVLWLAVRMVDYANRERPRGDALKVGGHQASSASLVTLMTALYLSDLRGEDRVAVKPHASPVLHAIEYLMGRLDCRYLTTLRDFGGLQPYPSRTKDPFPVDYSTGSVGLGSAAPLFGALADRYVRTHFGHGTGGRFVSLMGDAELDEGTIWEAVLEPQTRGLGNVLWIVDLNRQSLDRVVPVIRAGELEGLFETTGWSVIELKYGRRLRQAFAQEGGDLLRQQIDEMPNQRYQALFAASEEAIVESLLDGLAGSDRQRLARLLAGYDGSVGTLIQDLGGHDLADILAALRSARENLSRPTVIFAYTIKGYGLPIAGRPLNHSALLTAEQIDTLRTAVGLTAETEWDRFPPSSPEAELCEAARRRLERPSLPPRRPLAIPQAVSDRDPGTVSTQAHLGRVLLDLSRHPRLAERLVTISPDVAVSTSLGGWINKVGVFGREREPEYDPFHDSPLAWRVAPEGRHIELGISEMNLFLLLGQLGLTQETHGEQLFPVGTLYDPFVVRGLEALLYAVYSGSRFVVLGTPSGISLSREGGAHQSTITPGIGMELPGIVYAEPCFAREGEWLFLEGLRCLQEPDGEALYLRLSTKPVDQGPFAEALARRGETELRADILAGGFRLREPGPHSQGVVIAACGAIVPEALEAAELLAQEEGVEATVLCLSSPDRLYRGWRQERLRPLHDGSLPGRSHLEALVTPEERQTALVTVIDGASHALSFLGACLGMPTVSLGVDRFGQGGSQPDLYEAYGISPDAIRTAALVALSA
ncbi:MAG: pyruvate dehydrogenase [Thermoleophilia bacterium]